MFKFRKSILFIGILIVAAASSLITVAALFATGSIVADPIELIYTVEDISKTYDGTPLVANGYRLESGELKQGHSVTVEYTGSQTSVGVSESSMTVRVRDNDNHDVTAEYTIAVNSGTLTVEKCSVKLKVDDIKRVYGDEELVVTDDNCTFVEGRFAAGHTLQSFNLKMTGTGTFNNDEIIPHVFDANGYEVTDNYDLDLDIGTIEVVARPIIVKPVDVNDEFDNLPHTVTTGEVVVSDTTYGLVTGHYIRVEISGTNKNGEEVNSITNVDTIETEISSIQIFDQAGNDVSENYDISFRKGKLSVTQCPITVTAQSKTWTYDGQAHQMQSPSFDGFVLSGGKLPVNDQILSVEYSPETITDVGEIKSNIVKVNFGSSASNYNITYNSGTMAVIKRDLSVSTPNLTYQYDGKSHDGVNMNGTTAEQLTLSVDPGLVSGHSVELVEVSSLVDVGNISNVVEVDILDADKKSVKDNYKLDYRPGTLTVSPKNISIETRDVSHKFTGLVEFGVRKDKNGNFDTTNGDLTIKGETAEGQGLYLSGGATIYGVGTKRNSFATVKVYKIVDGKYDMTADVTSNYVISDDYGTLTIKENTDPAIRTKDFEKVYDGADSYVTSEIGTGSGYSNVEIYDLPTDGGNKLFKLYVDKKTTPYLKGVGTLNIRFDYKIYRIKPVTAAEQAEADGDYVYENILEDQSANFSVRFEAVGLMTVKPRPLTLSIDSDEKVYDGTPLEGSSDIDITNLAENIGGDEYIYDKVEIISVDPVSITNVGSVSNNVKYEILRHDYGVESTTFDEVYTGEKGVSYASCYDIDEQFGTLTVTKRYITIWSNSYTGFYDGGPHGEKELYSKLTGAPEDSKEPGIVDADKETVDISRVITVTDVTSAPIEHVLIYTLTNKATGLDASGNYEITANWGTLQVLPVYINIVTSSESAVYGDNVEIIDKKAVLTPIQGTATITPNENAMRAAWEKATDLDFSYSQQNTQKLIDDEEKISENLPSICYILDENGNATAGSMENSTELKFMRDKTTDTTGNFILREENANYGTLTILPRPLNVVVNTFIEYYNGKPHTAVRDTSTADRKLVAGDDEYDVEAASLIDVGMTTGTYTFKIHRDVKGAFVDTTACYKIINDFNGIYVDPRPVTVTIGSINVVYDGFDHAPTKADMKFATGVVSKDGEDENIDEYGFVKGEFKSVTADEQYVNVDDSGTPTITLDVSRTNSDGREESTLGNYDIKYNIGTITIRKRTLTVYTPSFTREYNGQPLVSTFNPEEAGTELYIIKSLYDGNIVTESERTKTPTSDDPYGIGYLNTGDKKQIHYNFELVSTRSFPSVTNAYDGNGGQVTNYTEFNVRYTYEDTTGQVVTDIAPSSNIEVVCDMNSYLRVTPLKVYVTTPSGNLPFDNSAQDLTDGITLSGSSKKTIEDMGYEVVYDSDAFPAAPSLTYVGDGAPNVFTVKLVDKGSTQFGNDMRNFDIKYEYGTIKVVARPITIKIKDVTATYDGKEHSYRDNIDGYEITRVNGLSSLNDINVYAKVKSYAKLKYAGEIANEIEFEFISTKDGKETAIPDGNFVFDNDSTIGKIVVNKLHIAIKSIDIPKTYDGSELRNGDNQLPQVYEWIEGELEYVSSPEINLADYGDEIISVTGISSITNAGSVANKIIVTISNQSSYEITYVYGTLTVNKKSITVTTASTSFTYDGNPHSDSSYTCDGIVGNDVLTLEGYFTAINVADSGANDCKYSHPNYNITVDKGTITIVPRDVYITTGSYREYYDGNSHSAKSYTVSNAIGNVTSFEIVGTYPSVKDVVQGVVENKIELDVGENYNPIYSYGTLEVIPLPVQVTSATVSRPYNGEKMLATDFQTLQYGSILLKNAVENEDLNYATPSFTSSEIAASATSAPISNAFTITWKNKDEEKNYNITPVFGTITITKATASITFKSSSRVYDGTDFSSPTNVNRAPLAEFVEVTGIVSSDKFDPTSWLSYSGDLTWQTAGTHTFTMTPNSNVKWDNYTVTTTGTPKMIIEKCTLNITTGSASFIYDKKPHSCGEFFYDESALPLNHTVDLAPGTLPERTDVGTTVNNLTVIVKFRGTDATSNFTIIYANGNIVINASSTTITSKDITKVYDGKSFDLNNSDNFVFDNPDLKDEFIITSTVTDFNTVGTAVYSFDVMRKDEQPLGSNYQITKVYGTITITPARVVFTAPSLSGTYNGNNFFPEDTDIITVSGDISPSEYNISFTGDKEAINVGTYEIGFNVTLANPDNYEVVKNYGSIVITPTVLNVLVRDYAYVSDGQDHSLDPEASVLEAVEINGTGGVTLGIENFRLTGDATIKGEVVEIGSYYYKAELKPTLSANERALIDKNYNIIYNRGVVQITQYSVTVFSKSAVKEYDGTPLIERSQDVVEEGNFKITYIYSEYATITDVGTVDNKFEVKVEIKLEDGRFIDVTEQTAINKVEGTLTVIKANLRVVSSSKSTLYTGNEIKLDEFKVVAKDLNGTVEADIVVDDTVSVGKHKIEFNVTDLLNEDGESVYHNYNVIPEYGTLEVSKRKITYHTPSSSYIYDGNPHQSDPYSGNLADKGWIDGDGLAPNHDQEERPLDGTNYASVTNAGDVVVNERVLYIYLKGSYTTDVADCYDITYDFGTLTVSRRTITVQTKNVIETYSGEPISDDTLSILGTLEGFFAKAKLDGEAAKIVELTTVGSVTNSYEAVIKKGTPGDTKAVDVTDNFIINYVYGTLTVTPAPLTVTTGSYTWYYDGTARTGNDEEIAAYNKVTDGVNGEKFDFKPDTWPVMDTVGSKLNAPEIMAIAGDADLANYDVKYNYGTLVMLAGQYQFQSKSLTVEYSGGAVITDTPVITDTHISNFVTCKLNGVAYDGDFKVKLVGTNYTDAGSYAITFEVTEIDGEEVDSKLHNISYSYGTLTINPKPVEIKLDTLTVEYKGTVNDFFSTYGIDIEEAILTDEFAYGISESDFDYDDIYITDAGTVPYTVKYIGSNNAANYDFKIGTGIIIVERRLATVTLATHEKDFRKGGYTLTTPTPDTANADAIQLDAFASFSGFIDADGNTISDVEVLKGYFTCPELTMKVATSYTFTVTVNDASILRNYDLNIVPGYVNISAATIGVTATVQSKNYSGAEFQLTLDGNYDTGATPATVGLTFDQDYGLTADNFVLVGANKFTNAGKYSFSLQFKNALDNNNYVLKLSGCSFEIEKFKAVFGGGEDKATLNYSGSTTSVFDGSNFEFDATKFSIAGKDWTVRATMTQSKFSYDAEITGYTVRNAAGEDITSNVALSGTVHIERTQLTVTVSLAALMASTNQKAFNYEGKSATKYVVISLNLVKLTATNLEMSVDISDEGDFFYTVSGLANDSNFDLSGATDGEGNVYVTLSYVNRGAIEII